MVTNLSPHRVADRSFWLVDVIRAIVGGRRKAYAFTADSLAHHQIGINGQNIGAKIIKFNKLTGGLAGAIAVNIVDIDDQVLKDHQVTVAGG